MLPRQSLILTYTMLYTDLDGMIAEMSLPILAQLAPWVDGVDEATGEYFNAGVSDTLLDRLNAVAVGELHGYVRGIYTVPFAEPADSLVTQTVQELMHYLLYKQRDAANLPDAVVELYKQAVKRMEKMQRREVMLSADLLAGDTDTEPATFRVIAPEAKFPAGFTRF